MPTRVPQNDLCFLSVPLQCAESGVKYLESMLSVRSPLILDEQENVDVKDIDMVHLLKEGLYYCFREGPWVIMLTK